jgi:hypothetical protein
MHMRAALFTIGPEPDIIVFCGQVVYLVSTCDAVSCMRPRDQDSYTLRCGMDNDRCVDALSQTFIPVAR